MHSNLLKHLLNTLPLFEGVSVMLKPIRLVLRLWRKNIGCTGAGGCKRAGAGAARSARDEAATRAARGQRTFETAVRRPPARAARARFNLPQRDRN